MIKIGIINSEISNLRNVYKAVSFIGGDPFFIYTPEDLRKADKVILPGVGSFARGMDGLKKNALDEALKEHARSGKKLLGICLGMQLLLDESLEFGHHQGLSLIPGKVLPLPNDRKFSNQKNKVWNLKVPHVGWDEVEIKYNKETLKLQQGQKFSCYFTHSFAVYPENSENLLGQADSGYGPYCAMINRDNVLGYQFHVELSAETGLKMLKNFLEW